MSKRVWKNDVRIEVTPKRFGFTTEDSHIADCKDMVDQIKRHVDGVDYCEVVWDTSYTCSYCGLDWDEDTETGEPLCCNAAQEEWDYERNGKIAQEV